MKSIQSFDNILHIMIGPSLSIRIIKRNYSKWEVVIMDYILLAVITGIVLLIAALSIKIVNQ